MGLAIQLVCDARDVVALFVEPRDPRLLDERDPVRLRLGKLFYPLHESICDGHARELGVMATMGSGLGMSTAEQLERVGAGKRDIGDDVPEPRNECQIQVEDILEPLDCCRRLVRQDFDQIRPRLIAGGLQGIIVKLLHAVLNLVVDLGSREGAVYAGRGFGRVAAEEA